MAQLEKTGITTITIPVEISEQHIRDSLADALRDIANSISPSAGVNVPNPDDYR